MQSTKKFQKPTMVGGTAPPKDTSWKIYAINQQASIVIGALARHRGVPNTDVINSMVNFYRKHYSDELNKAFNDHKETEGSSS